LHGILCARAETDQETPGSLKEQALSAMSTSCECHLYNQILLQCSRENVNGDWVTSCNLRTDEQSVFTIINLYVEANEAFDINLQMEANNVNAITPLFSKELFQ